MTTEAEGLAGSPNPDPVLLTEALVAVPSVNPLLEEGGDGEGAISALTAEWLTAWGFRVEVEEFAPGRFNTVGYVGSGEGPTLLFNGHLDTVGVQGMTVPPFGADRTDGRLWGRGACDMKAGVGALLAAGARIADEGGRGNLIVALTGDEEHGSLGIQALLNRGLGADAAVVCEPTDLAVMPANKGFIWVEVEFTGRAAHGSRPDEGVDAIRHAARYLGALDRYELGLTQGEPHRLLGHASVHAGTIEGGVAPSVYPERCQLVIERRTLPGEDDAAVLAEFQELLDELGGTLPDLRAKLTPGIQRPGTEVALDSPLVRHLLGACGAQGVAQRVEGMTAYVDAALLNVAGIPAVCFGPGSIAQAHSADEWVEVDQIRQCAAVLTRFARTFLGRG